ncbi:terminase [Herminiimonas contaminans]|uniref:Terminase n=1 Tax=Herminiimonas contaminans TaxID=1111140 RepID=A0ABS0ESK2_9BURK|nr:terminase [Herminiimonas contaminans]MBF8177818.1 terminase [Herminiimonas contaminans]
MTPEEQLKQELIEDIASFTHDPLGYVLYSFDWGAGELAKFPDGPDQWQRDVLNEIGDKLKSGAISGASEAIQIAVASGHGIGKSALICWLIKWGLDTFEDTKGVVTANTDNQLRTKTWAELAKWHRLSITRDWFNCSATALASVDKAHEKTWRIDAIPWSENNTEAFAGLHNQGRRIIVVFDEASKIADPIWEVTEGALTDNDTEIIWVAFGNPTQNTGRFRECFRKFRHRWSCRQIDSRTVKITNKKQMQQWVDDYGEDSDFVKVRVRGMFPSASAKQFISVEDVDEAQKRHLRADQYDFAPKILTVDPSWSGDDPFVIGLRQGLRFRVLRSIPKNDNDIQMANLIAQLEDEHEADAVFIDAGYGTGIKSAGDTMGRAWQLVWFGEKATDHGFLNKRSEMWGGIKTWLKAGGAIEDDAELYQDLISPETVPRMDGKIQLESKPDMKARGLPSPNKGDALALSFAYPVGKRYRGIPGLNKSGLATEYDPYAG